MSITEEQMKRFSEFPVFLMACAHESSGKVTQGVMGFDLDIEDIEYAQEIFDDLLNGKVIDDDQSGMVSFSRTRQGEVSYFTVEVVSDGDTDWIRLEEFAYTLLRTIDDRTAHPFVVRNRVQARLCFDAVFENCTEDDARQMLHDLLQTATNRGLITQGYPSATVEIQKTEINARQI
jgi:hypothetical protein